MFPPTSRGNQWTFSPTLLAKCSRWQFEHTASLPSFDGRVESQHQQVFSVLNVDSNTCYELVSGTKEKGKDSPINGTSTSVGPAMSRSKRQNRGSSWLLEPKNEVLKIPLTTNQRCVSSFSPTVQPFPESSHRADSGGGLRRPSKRVDIDHGQQSRARSDRCRRRHTPARTRRSLWAARVREKRAAVGVAHQDLAGRHPRHLQ